MKDTENKTNDIPLEVHFFADCVARTIAHRYSHSFRKHVMCEPAFSPVQHDYNMNRMLISSIGKTKDETLEILNLSPENYSSFEKDCWQFIGKVKDPEVKEHLTSTLEQRYAKYIYEALTHPKTKWCPTKSGVGFCCNVPGKEMMVYLSRSEQGSYDGDLGTAYIPKNPRVAYEDKILRKDNMNIPGLDRGIIPNATKSKNGKANPHEKMGGIQGYYRFATDSSAFKQIATKVPKAEKSKLFHKLNAVMLGYQKDFFQKLAVYEKARNAGTTQRVKGYEIYPGRSGMVIKGTSINGSNPVIHVLSAHFADRASGHNKNPSGQSVTVGYFNSSAKSSGDDSGYLCVEVIEKGDLPRFIETISQKPPNPSLSR